MPAHVDRWRLLGLLTAPKSRLFLQNMLIVFADPHRRRTRQG